MNRTKLYIRQGEGAGLDIVELPEGQEPPDGEFCYVLGAGGLYKRIANQIYEGVVPVDRCPQLGEQPQVVGSKLPPIPRAVIETVVGFFKQAWDEYASEAIVLLYYSPSEEKYLLLVPRQEVDVWEKDAYGWFRTDLKYETPNTPTELLHRGYRPVGSIHSHGDYWAGHSSVDVGDEKNRNGLHVTVGRVNSDKPQFSCSFVVQDTRRKLETEEVIEGYEQPRQPRERWIKLIKKGESPWAQRLGRWPRKKGYVDRWQKRGNGEGDRGDVR